MDDFLEVLEKGEDSSCSRSSISRSVESHLMAYAAEQARVQEKVVKMDELKGTLQR